MKCLYRKRTHAIINSGATINFLRKCTHTYLHTMRMYSICNCLFICLIIYPSILEDKMYVEYIVAKIHIIITYSWMPMLDLVCLRTNIFVCLFVCMCVLWCFSFPWYMMVVKEKKKSKKKQKRKMCKHMYIYMLNTFICLLFNVWVCFSFYLSLL